MRAERLAEIGQVAEAPAVSGVRNIQQPLSRIAQRRGAGFEAVFQHPASERLSDLAEARMQRSDGNAEMVGRLLRRQLGIVKMLPAESEQRLELQLGLQAPRRNAVRGSERHEIAEAVREQASLGLAERRTIGRKLHHVESEEVGKPRPRGQLAVRQAAPPGRPALDHGARHHRDRAASTMLAAVMPAKAKPDVAGMERDSLFAPNGDGLAAQLQIDRVMLRRGVGVIAARPNDLIARIRFGDDEAKRAAAPQGRTGGKHTWWRLRRRAEEAHGGVADDFTPIGKSLAQGNLLGGQNLEISISTAAGS